MSTGWTVRPLAYRDQRLAEVQTPNERLRLTLGLGSGLTRRKGDPADRLWAVGDRGANIKIKDAVGRYGLAHLAAHRDRNGAKVIPRPDLGPTIAELRRVGDAIELVRTIPIRTAAGRTLTGLPLPGAMEADMEPALSLAGDDLAPDPAGADTEAIAALSDGTFLVAEEYGPSVMRIDAEGVVLERWLPMGSPLKTDPPARLLLPAIAADRRLNRGFESLAVSPDERLVHVALQSAIPGETRVRLWTLELATGALLAEHFYPFDPPESFLRDVDDCAVGPEDLKVCEIASVGEGRLLVLERISRSAKVYAVELGLDAVLEKRLLISTDDVSDFAPDLEGMAVISDRALILVTDNDFGVEGAETRFYEVSFTKPFFA